MKLSLYEMKGKLRAAAGVYKQINEYVFRIVSMSEWSRSVTRNHMPKGSEVQILLLTHFYPYLSLVSFPSLPCLTGSILQLSCMHENTSNSYVHYSYLMHPDF